MKREAGLCLVLALATIGATSGADTAEQEEGQKPAASSNAVEWPTPQLSANTNPGADIPLVQQPDRLAGRSSAPVPHEALAHGQSRNIWAVTLAILALVASRFVLRRLRSRSGQS